MLREGYFGIGMMNHATLCEKKYYVPHISSLKSSRFSAAYFIIIFAVMFSGWRGIYSEQATGMYLCQQMYVQLDDEFAPTLDILSGIYTVNQNEHFGGRVTSSQEKNGQGKIGYCEDENVWTLKIQDPLVPYDPCLDWVAKSSQSFDFDVLKTTSSQWRELDYNICMRFIQFVLLTFVLPTFICIFRRSSKLCKTWLKTRLHH
jgi:hypothetical protein